MGRNTVVLIWVLGIGLALLLIYAGPNPVEAAITQVLGRIEMGLDQLDAPAIAILRAVGIALFFVFLGLCVVALRQGQPAIGTAIVVSLFFLLFAGEIHLWPLFQPHPHWVAAFLVSLFASLAMTRRVLGPARRAR